MLSDREKRTISLNGVKWGVYCRDEADRSVYNEIFKFREYRAADQAIQEADYPIVDVGAHAGFFTLYCRALNKEVAIYSLEPESKNLKFFRRHIKENKIKGVKIIEGALAQQTGERELILSSDSHAHKLASGGPTTMRKMKTKTFSLPDFCKINKIRKISLLKIDIEGGEYEVFPSLSSGDLAIVKFALLEYHNGNKYKQIENKLRECGFSVHIFPCRFDKTMGLIFARNKRYEVSLRQDRRVSQ